MTNTYCRWQSSITLEEVQNARDFVKKLDRLELPSQLAAVLEDPLLQKLLALRPSGAFVCHVVKPSYTGSTDAVPRLLFPKTSVCAGESAVGYRCNCATPSVGVVLTTV